MRLVRVAGRLVAQTATALLAGGLTVRLTIGDSVPGLAAIYYATPWAILTAMGIFPAMLWAHRRRWVPVLGFVVVSLLCGVAWVRTSFKRTPAAVASLRVAYWNVGRPDEGLGAVLDLVHGINAHIFGFGETRVKKSTGPQHPAWKDRQPDKNTLALRRGMLLATPEPASQLHDGFLNDRGQYALTETLLSGRKIFVLMVDFDAIVSWSRKPAFDRLIELIDSIGDEPLVVMGDFNTPSDSSYFPPLRTRLRSAFEDAGSGYAHTWPMPLPVLDLDQIWVSHHFKIVGAEHRTSFLSDHRPIIADLELK